MQEGSHCVFCQDVVADLLLHETKMFGNVLLVLPVILLRQFEDPVAESEDVLVRSMSRI